MQLKTLLPSILLLAIPEAVFAAPDDTVPVRYVRASSLGISKRNPFALDMQPVYKAMDLDATPLVKRQSCPVGSTACFTGCCNLGTVCGIYGGEEGCCPVGKQCGRVSGCQNAEDVDCDTYCCPSGSVCTTDSSGEGTCGKKQDDTGNGQCETGFSACTIFQGCCPNGSECMLPRNCNIPCASDDPICGDGCCQKGYVCTADLTCAQDNSNDFTTLAPTTTRTRTRTTATEDSTTELSTETSTEESSTETTESSSSTDIFPNGSDSTTTTTTQDAATTTTRRTIVTTQTLNAAPTMGVMLGGSLGMAAGIIGVLAM